MELRHLRYFVAVAEERHFGRAAERLHIAQPPLSQQIRRFEAELGEPLLYRTTRSVELAPAGEVLLERGREILAAVDSRRRGRAPRRARRVRTPRHRLHRLVRPTRCCRQLAAALRDELPGVVLDLRGELLTPGAGLAAPRRHARPRRSSGLRSTSATSAPRCSAPSRSSRCSPNRHPLAAAEAVPLERLEGEPFVTYPSHFRSVVHDAVEDACAAHGFEPLAAHEVAETATLVSFVAAGLGVSLVPASVRNMTVRGAVYRPLVARRHPRRARRRVAPRRRASRPRCARSTSSVASSARADNQVARGERAPYFTADAPLPN